MSCLSTQKKFLNSGFNNFQKEINQKNLLFNLYDDYFINNKKSVFNNCDVIQKNILTELYQSKNDIPYFDDEPEYMYISFKNIFDIYIAHHALRIKYSILKYIGNCSNYNTINEWNRYIDFLLQNNYIEKYKENIINGTDCLNYLNYIKNNTCIKIEFIKLDEYKKDDLISCNNCNISFNERINIFFSDTGNCYCKNCGLILEDIFNDNIEIEDTNLNDTNSEFDTNIYKFSKDDSNSKILEKEENDILNSIDLKNFSNRLDCFQGKQSIKPSEQIIKNLINYIDNNKEKYLKGKSCEFVRNLKNNSEKREYITLIEFEKIFKELKDVSYIKDIEYIFHKIFNWKLINLYKYQEIILYDYLRIQKEYNKIKKRDSNLNINIRLLFQLSLIGIKIDKNDIKLIKSKESINYHIKVFKEISKNLDFDITTFLNYFEDE